MPTIDSVVLAPVVSSESTSPEAILARKSREIEAQAQVDTIYDTKIERFYVEPLPISLPLISVTVVLGLWSLALLLLSNGRK
jgi:hypothetical protein